MVQGSKLRVLLYLMSIMNGRLNNNGSNNIYCSICRGEEGASRVIEGNVLLGMGD